MELTIITDTQLNRFTKALDRKGLRVSDLAETVGLAKSTYFKVVKQKPVAKTTIDKIVYWLEHGTKHPVLSKQYRDGKRRCYVCKVEIDRNRCICKECKKPKTKEYRKKKLKECPEFRAKKNRREKVQKYKTRYGEYWFTKILAKELDREIKQEISNEKDYPDYVRRLLKQNIS